MLERIERKAAKVGLKINVNKSKKMRIATNNNETLCIHSETIERVTQFAYLGSIIDSTGGTEADNMARIRKVQIAFSALNSILNANKTSYLQYQRESSPTLWLWDLDKFKNLTAKLQVFINKCLRKILRIFWPDQITNKELWKRTEQPRIDLQIRKRKWGWLGHTLRKPSDVIARQP